jgi:hypothetical protein
MNCFKKVIPITNAVDYKTLNIQPFDIIEFKGGDFVSTGIRIVSKASLGGRYQAGKFSHTGMIITKDVLNIPLLEQGKLYIWESTISGKLGGDVDNIEGHAFLGVQIREFDKVIKSYLTPNTAAALLKLKDRSPIEVDDIQAKTLECFNKYNGIPYTINIMQLFAAAYPKVRWLTPTWGKYKFLFCSELVSCIYRDVGIFPSAIQPCDVIPADFVSDGEPDIANRNIPNYFENYIYLKN